MEFVIFFLKICLIIVSAKALAKAFNYLRLPDVLGEVLAGVIIGPSLLGIVGQEDIFVLLSDVGVLFLLFHVGLESDIARLKAVGNQAFMVAVTGVIAPFITTYFVCRYAFGFTNIAALFAGGTLVATSIGITVRVFRDLKKQHTHAAHVVLGAAVIDDIIGVVVLAVLMRFNTAEGADLGATIKALLLLGAFGAGLALTGGRTRRIAGIIRKNVMPVGGLLIPVFFVMVGVSMDLHLVNFSSPGFWVFAASLTVIAFLTKLVSGVWAHGPLHRKLTVGVAMAPRGEVGLVFAGIGLSNGFFDQPAYASMVFVVTLTTLLAPVFLRLLERED